MRRLSALSFSLVTALASSAAAQDPLVVDDGTVIAEEGEVYTERGITLPARTLRVDLGPSEQGINNSGFINGPFGSTYGLRFGQQRTHVDGDDTATEGIATMGFGASYGITDWLEVGTNLMPIAIDSPAGIWNDSGDAGFGNITLYGRAAFVNTEMVQIGGQLAFSIPTGYDAFGMGFGLPVNFNLGALRLETGIELETFVMEGPELLSVDIPVAVSVGLGDFWVGGHTAIDIVHQGEDNTFLIIPLGAHAGYSFRGGALDADLTATFSYHIFTNSDLAAEGTRYSEWVLGLGGTLFFPL